MKSRTIRTAVASVAAAGIMAVGAGSVSAGSGPTFPEPDERCKVPPALFQVAAIVDVDSLEGCGFFEDPNFSSGTDGARPVPAGAATHPRRGLLLAAAAGIVGAVAGGTVVSVTRSDDGDPGLPLEAVGLQGVPAGVRADASVVDHTWGMELLLDVEGLPVGDRYDVVFVARNGDRLPVGGFVGAEVPVLCRNTSSLLRADAASVEVVDAGGAVVMSSTLA